MEALFRRRFFVVHLVLLALCAILLARVANVFVGRVLMDKLGKPDASSASRPPPPPKPVASRDFDAASTSNIFEGKRENLVEGPAAGAFDPNKPISDDDWQNAPRSSTRLRLVGTAVFSMSEFSLASIIDEAKAGTPAESFSTNACVPVSVDVGDPNSQLAGKPRPCNKVNDTIILKRIEPERAYLLNDGHLEYIAIGEPPAKAGAPAPVASAAPSTEDLGKDIKRLSETNYEVGQNEVDKALGNLAGLASDARIVPSFEGGKSTGFKMFSIRPGSLYSKIGLQNGDVVTRINGYEISSPDKALEIYQKLKDSKHVTVDLTRRGKPSTMEYNITP